MKQYSDLDMRGNHLRNCPDVFQSVDITRADYEALVAANQDDPNVYYNITDDSGTLPPVESIIDNTQTSDVTTWSSNKIAEMIAQASSAISFVDNQAGGRTMNIGGGAGV